MTPEQMKREEIDLMYDRWLANDPSAVHFYDCHGFGREAWHAAFKAASQSEAEQRETISLSEVDRKIRDLNRDQFLDWIEKEWEKR